jgi:quinol-cytochrome oxidoreductase complex cytochrome b subunit
MFYYHPTKVQAFRDILYLEHDVPFGKLLRNMHRWARTPWCSPCGCTCSGCS